MNTDWTPASVGRRARTVALTAIFALGAALPTACTSHSSGSGCVVYDNPLDFAFSDTETVGFDIDSPTRAVLGIALDGTDAALVISFRHSSSFAIGSQALSPTCDTTLAIETYTYDTPDTVTVATYDANPYMQRAVTDTDGVLDMAPSMNALLIRSNPTRYYLAASGTIVANRIAGPKVEVVGSLTFVEIDGASPRADVVVGGDVLRIDDINFNWDTAVQPMPL